MLILKRTLVVVVALLPACALIVELPEGRDESSSGGGSAGAGGSGAGGGAACKLACDCDEDGVLGNACAGTDCADDDANVKPGQTEYFTTPSTNVSVGFDYDCSGSADREFTKPVKCSGVALVSCDTKTQGFLEALPQCGQSGEWGTCKKGAVACEKDVVQNKVLACK